MSDPAADDAEVDEFLAKTAKQQEENEAESELLRWGGSVKGLDRDAGSSKSAEDAQEPAEPESERPAHFAIHTPISAAPDHADKASPQHTEVTGLEADADVVAPSNGMTQVEEETAQVPTIVIADSDSASDSAVELERQPESPGLVQPSAEEASATSAADAGPTHSAPEASHPTRQFDITALPDGRRSRTQPAQPQQQNQVPVDARHSADAALSPVAVHASSLPPKVAAVGSSAAPVPPQATMSHDSDGSSVEAQLSSFKQAMAGFNSDIHRLAAEGRSAKFHFQAIDTRQSDLERGHSDLGLRLQELESRLQSLAEAEGSPISMASGNLHERVAALERAQKTVAKGLRRVLQGSPMASNSAAVVHQPGPHHLSQDNHASPSMVTTPPAAAHRPSGYVLDDHDGLRDQVQAHEHRLAELDAFCAVARMELRAPRMPARFAQDTTVSIEDISLIDRRLELQAIDLATLRRDVDALLQGDATSPAEPVRLTPPTGAVHQPNMGTAQSASGSWSQVGTRLLSQDPHPAVDQTSLELRFDTRLEASLHDMRQRMEVLKQAVEQRIHQQISDLSRQVPQAAARLDSLTLQCQDCFSKVEAQEVRIGMLSTSVDLQEQRLQGTVERVERAHSATSATRLEREAALVSATTVLTGRVDAHAQVLEDLRDRVQDLCRHSKSGSPSLSNTPHGHHRSGSHGPGSPSSRVVDVVAASRLEPIPWSSTSPGHHHHHGHHGNGCVSGTRSSPTLHVSRHGGTQHRPS